MVAETGGILNPIPPYSALFRPMEIFMTNQLIDPSGLVPPERDACAIICYINKEARPTHGNVQRTIEALIKMGHRAGEINGEGDGCGVLTDIPRMIWREVLASAGHDPNLAEATGFAVGHLLLPKEATAADPQLQEKIQIGRAHV